MPEAKKRVVIFYRNARVTWKGQLFTFTAGERAELDEALADYLVNDGRAYYAADLAPEVARDQELTKPPPKKKVAKGAGKSTAKKTAKSKKAAK